MVLYSQCFDLRYETFLPFASRTFSGSSLRSKVAISLTSALLAPWRFFSKPSVTSGRSLL
jgi:hypothetical protein